MSEPLQIRERPPLWSAVTLLKAQGLPISDITDEHLEHFFFPGENARGSGLGAALVVHAERYAVFNKVQSISLLTMTAEAFFKRLGYERINRSRAPPRLNEPPSSASLAPRARPLW